VSKLRAAQRCMVTAAAVHACRYALAELRAAVLAYVKSSFFLMHRTSLGGDPRDEKLQFLTSCGQWQHANRALESHA
jgi:hypothetical protein